MSPLVLAYHGVDAVPFDRDVHRLFVVPEQIERDVRLLRAWGFEIAPFAEVARRVRDAGPEGAGPVAALTFDDGLADNLHRLLPVLRSLDATATVFPVSGWLGGQHRDAPWAPMLTVDDVRALHRAGVEIGSHGRDHLDLTGVDDESTSQDLVAGRADLEGVIDAPVTSLAYPFGAADDRVRAAAAQAGFFAACRTSGRGSWTDPFDLPRQAMGNGSSRLGLRLKRHDHYEQLMRWALARRARRVSRRLHNRRALRRAALRPTAAQPPAG